MDDWYQILYICEILRGHSLSHGEFLLDPVVVPMKTLKRLPRRNCSIQIHNPKIEHWPHQGELMGIGCQLCIRAALLSTVTEIAS